MCHRRCISRQSSVADIHVRHESEDEVISTGVTQKGRGLQLQLRLLQEKRNTHPAKHALRLGMERARGGG